MSDHKLYPIEEMSLTLGAAVLTRIIRDLSHDEREQVIGVIMGQYGCDRAAVEAFLNAHPDMIIDDALKDLKLQRLIEQDKAFLAELAKKRLTSGYQDLAMQASFDRMQDKISKNMQALNNACWKWLNKSTLSPRHLRQLNDQIANADGILKGTWAEWKLAEYYGERRQLLSFGKKLGKTEIDVVVRDGNSVRFIQLKSYDNSFGVNDPGRPSGLSKRFEDLQERIAQTQKVANNPHVIAGLKRDYPWFDGKIQTETDLVNTKPLDPNKPGWKNVADRLRKDNPGSHIDTTDPNDPGMQPGNLNYEPDNPLNNPCFREILSTLPPPASTNWCCP